MDLAPIGLSTYTRINHLKQTIQALQRNTLAKESEIYIFSDAPKKGDEPLVRMVRDYLYTVDGFKNIKILERKKNNRIANNRGGINLLLEKYGKMIFLEEDNVTARGFLKFINDGLEFYKDDHKIDSISGFCPPIDLPDYYERDIYILPNFNGWGVGLWKRSMKNFDSISFEKFKNLCLEKGNHLKYYVDGGRYLMLPKEIAGTLNAGDVRFTFHELLYKHFSLYPSINLVRNIGNDGSGEHCRRNLRYDKMELSEKIDFSFENNIKLDAELIDKYKNLRKIFWPRKTLSFIRYPKYHYYFLKGLSNSCRTNITNHL